MAVKRKSQIDDKDLSDEVSKVLANQLDALRNQLMQVTYSAMLIDVDFSLDDWYKKQISRKTDLLKQIKKMSKNGTKKVLASVDVGLGLLDLSSNQKKNIKSEIKAEINNLKNVVISNYNSDVTGIVSQTVLKNGVTDSLFDTIQQKITKTNDYGIVTYKDGRNIRWENYMEMKVRTDIQNDIGKNMVEAGLENGVVFYICSYHGDCAPDHKDYQGKIYVDKNWKQNIKDVDIQQQIQSYIISHSVKTIQEIMGPNVYLSTRPNCRHYFQYISIDEVLAIKNDDDLNNKREELNLNSKGKYKPEKYEALKQQRYNERKIRKIKGAIETQQKIIDNLPNDAPNWLKSKIANDMHSLKIKLSACQKKQRDLIKNNLGVLDRNYSREVYNKMISNMGVKPLPKVEFDSIIKSIGEVKTTASIYSSKLVDLYTSAKGIDPLEGYHDIVCHCDGLKFQYENTNGDTIVFDVVKMCRYIKSDKTYKGGPIRLVACSSGNELVAQRMADILGVNVYAPTEDVNFLQLDGGKYDMILGNLYAEYGIKSGEWILFKPHKKKGNV